MTAIPGSLLDDLSPSDRAAAQVWWSGLSDAARSEIVDLCDRRRDLCLFTLEPGDSEDPPRVIGGRFIPSDEMAGWDEWHAEYLEYLLNHAETVFEPPFVRTFHIGCTRHESARKAVAEGRIPDDFVCPVHESDCPLRALLGARRDPR